MIYTYARLGRGDFGFYRLFGEGLGNTLFPWARSMVAARKDHLTEIWPAWRQVFHRGGWRDVWKEVRRGYGLKNLRNYNAIFQPTGRQLTGLRKVAPLLRGRTIREEEYLSGGTAPLRGECVVLFEGMRAQFEDLLDEHEFLRAELWARTAPEVRARVSDLGVRRSICVHIRLGDFPAHRLEDALQLGHNSRLPQSWYVEKVLQLRLALGSEWPVLVFSDGLDSELAEILAVPNSRRVSFGSALADLWAMAAVGVMVCSLSTLNKWACYLGRPPAIRLRGLMPCSLYTENTRAEIESGIGEALPPSFIQAVRERAETDVAATNPGVTAAIRMA